MCADHLQFFHGQEWELEALCGERNLLCGQISCRMDEWKAASFIRGSLMVVHECLFTETVVFPKENILSP